MSSYHNHQYGGGRGYVASASAMGPSSGSYRSSGGAQQHQHPPPPPPPPPVFTAEMRDRQARGKDPYHESGDSSDASDWGSGPYRGSEYDPFAAVDKRRTAAQVLDTPELLMINAQRDNDSIPATRLRYTHMLCGIEEPKPRRHHTAKTSSTSSSSKSKSKSKPKKPSSSSSRHGGGGSSSSSRQGGSGAYNEHA